MARDTALSNVLGAVNTAGLFGTAVGLMTLEEKLALLTTGTPEKSRRFVNNAALPGGIGTLQKPYNSLKAAFDALGEFAVDKAGYETPMQLSLAPGDYSAEGALNIPQRASFTIYAPGSKLPPLQVKPRLDKQFGSTVLPTYSIEGNADSLTAVLNESTLPLPAEVVAVGDVNVAVDASNTFTFVEIRNALVSGKVLFAGDWFAAGYSPELTFDGVAFAAGSSIGQGPGASTPVGTLRFRNGCIIAHPSFSVDAEAVNEYAQGYAIGTWTLQAVPGGASIIQGWTGVYVDAAFTWVPFALGSMFLDTTTNYWVNTNGAAVAAPDKTLIYDPVP